MKFSLKHVVLVSGIFFSIIINIRAQVFYNNKPVFETKENDTSFVELKKIELIGNKKTKPEIIVRELLFSTEEQVSLNQFIAAQKRVLNTNLFTQVRFDIVGDRSYSTLLITVHERWYIYPLPIFYMNERSWKKLSYGGQLRYYNFLGKDIIIKLTAAFGYNPEFRFNYYNPWFFGDLKLFTNFTAYKGKVKAQSLELDGLEYDSKGIDWLFGKRFGHFFFTGFNISHQVVKTFKGSNLTFSQSGRDARTSLILSFQLDNRDLKEYPHRGFNIMVWVKRSEVNHCQTYYRYGTNIRTYVPLSRDLTLALRGATNLSSGKIPLYDRVYFGYEERIRGRFYDTVEGENLLFGGAELRFPLLRIRYISLPSVPELEDYSSHLKFGISAGIFYDTGVVWWQEQKLSIDDFRSGFGAGIHFHLPYIDVFRVECALNKEWQTQAIAEVEVAF